MVELQGRFQVYIVNGDNQVESWCRYRPVPFKGNDIVIESGLKGGETVIVEGVQKVRPGMLVDPQPYEPACSARAVAGNVTSTADG